MCRRMQPKLYRLTIVASDCGAGSQALVRGADSEQWKLCSFAARPVFYQHLKPLRERRVQPLVRWCGRGEAPDADAGNWSLCFRMDDLDRGPGHLIANRGYGRRSSAGLLRHVGRRSIPSSGTVFAWQLAHSASVQARKGERWQPRSADCRFDPASGGDAYYGYALVEGLPFAPAQIVFRQRVTPVFGECALQRRLIVGSPSKHLNAFC
jgi:hypothetical protein